MNTPFQRYRLVTEDGIESFDTYMALTRAIPAGKPYVTWVVNRAMTKIVQDLSGVDNGSK